MTSEDWVKDVIKTGRIIYKKTRSSGEFSALIQVIGLANVLKYMTKYELERMGVDLVVSEQVEVDMEVVSGPIVW